MVKCYKEKRNGEKRFRYFEAAVKTLRIEWLLCLELKRKQPSEVQGRLHQFVTSLVPAKRLMLLHTGVFRISYVGSKKFTTQIRNMK